MKTALNGREAFRKFIQSALGDPKVLAEIEGIKAAKMQISAKACWMCIHAQPPHGVNDDYEFAWRMALCDEMERLISDEPDIAPMIDVKRPNGEIVQVDYRIVRREVTNTLYTSTGPESFKDVIYYYESHIPGRFFMSYVPHTEEYPREEGMY